MTTEDEAALAPFFAAARAAPPEPPRAAAVGDPRRRGGGGRAAARRAGPRGRDAGDAVAPALGGWRGATALAACAALGFWLGLAGGGDDRRHDAAGRDGLVAADGGTRSRAFFELAAME